MIPQKALTLTVKHYALLAAVFALLLWIGTEMGSHSPGVVMRAQDRLDRATVSAVFGPAHILEQRL